MKTQNRQPARMATQVRGIVPIPRRDPNLTPWPRDVVQIVAATPGTVNVQALRGVVSDQTCADCGCRLAVDSFTIAVAWEMPERQARPLRFVCVPCYRTYDASQITKLIDHRQHAHGEPL